LPKEVFYGVFIDFGGANILSTVSIDSLQHICYTQNMPKQKMTKEKLKFFIQNAGKMDTTALARELGVDRSTLYHWKRKLKKKGISVNFSELSPNERMIEEVKKEL
jgi:transcriptional regulator of acetoin/glycerol metabolism